MKNEGPGPGCFVEGLRALGYRDGHNVGFEYRFAEGVAERLPALAAELVRLRPDVIFTFTTVGADAAAGATSTIPIVVGPAGERTFDRLAGNFARPVGNVTGLTLDSLEQDQKCLQLLKELAPRTSRVVVLLNPDNPNYRSHPGALQPAANHLGITLTMNRRAERLRPAAGVRNDPGKRRGCDLHGRRCCTCGHGRAFARRSSSGRRVVVCRSHLPARESRPTVGSCHWAPTTRRFPGVPRSTSTAY